MTQEAQVTTTTYSNRLQLSNRYVFEGELEMQTGLHIGGGKETLSYTDNPVVLTPDGLPFIPGSSLKGVLRSTVEKLVASLPTTLGLHTCGLPLEELPLSEETCPTAHPEAIRKERRKRPNDVAQIMEQVQKDLCHTCQLFGSPFTAAHIIVNDLYLIDEKWSGTTQIRDGVAIDRDSETAKNGFKYDFEVVPSTTVFKLRMIVENASSTDLQLIAIGLGEFISGCGGIGGLRSRGLGACILKKLTIRSLKLDDKDREQRLQSYLLRNINGADDGLRSENTEAFFKKHIEDLFKVSGQQKNGES